VILANELCLPDMARLLSAGADGYLVNELSAEAFSLSLLLVVKGEKVLPSTLASMLVNDCNSFDQGPKEPDRAGKANPAVPAECLQ
jgi:two-component system nitrate/nitrite response regulator NarL